MSFRATFEWKINCRYIVQHNDTKSFIWKFVVYLTLLSATETLKPQRKDDWWLKKFGKNRSWPNLRKAYYISIYVELSKTTKKHSQDFCPRFGHGTPEYKHEFHIR